MYLLTGRSPEGYRWQDDGTEYDATHLIEHLGSAQGAVNVREAVTYLLRVNLGTEPHAARVETLVSFVDSRGGRMDNNMIIAVLSLITAMPEYQLC